MLLWTASFSPLDAVPAVRSYWTSHRWWSPSATSSHTRSSSCSCSSVSMSHPSSSRSHARTRWSPSVVSSREESREGGYRRSRRSRSLSRTSSRGGSASPGRGKSPSRSSSPFQSRQADEDCQEEQSSLDFVAVVANLHPLNGLPEAPSDSRKIHGFRAALEDDDLLVASYKLPIGDTSADIDCRVSSMSPAGLVSRGPQQKILPFRGRGNLQV